MQKSVWTTLPMYFTHPLYKGKCFKQTCRTLPYSILYVLHTNYHLISSIGKHYPRSFSLQKFRACWLKICHVDFLQGGLRQTDQKLNHLSQTFCKKVNHFTTNQKPVYCPKTSMRTAISVYRVVKYGRSPAIQGLPPHPQHFKRIFVPVSKFVAHHASIPNPIIGPPPPLLGSFCVHSLYLNF